LKLACVEPLAAITSIAAVTIWLRRACSVSVRFACTSKL
jgi:hypothetical protein